MKKKKIMIVSLILAGCLLSYNVNAQWYKRYGVTDSNDLTENQWNTALEKAEMTINKGKNLTIAGGISIGIGSAIYGIGYASLKDEEGFDVLGEYLLLVTVSGAFSYLGSLCLISGIPTWIIGGSRKSIIIKAKKKYASQLSFTPYLNTHPNRSSVGLRLTLFF